MWNRELRCAADEGEHPLGQAGPERLEFSLTCSRQAVHLDLGHYYRLPRYLLVQHAFVCHDYRFLVKESLYGAVRQQVADGQETHALMMSHPAPCQFSYWRWLAPASPVIGCFVKAKWTKPVHVVHQAQIFEGVLSIHR